MPRVVGSFYERVGCVHDGWLEEKFKDFLLKKGVRHVYEINAKTLEILFPVNTTNYI